MIDADALPTSIEAAAARVSLYARPRPGERSARTARSISWCRRKALTAPALDAYLGRRRACPDLEAQLRATGARRGAGGAWRSPRRGSGLARRRRGPGLSLRDRDLILHNK